MFKSDANGNPLLKGSNMKMSVWDILTFLLVIGIIVVAGFAFLLFINPDFAFNPFPPEGGGLSALFIPSSTPTPRRLPPTWTPTARPTEANTPTRRPTSTLLPTFTPFVLPTLTPAPKTVYPTNERPSLVGKCKVVNQTPADGSSVAPGAAFTTLWTLQNTSDRDWTTDSLDLRYRGGTPMHTSKDLIDFPTNVRDGGTFDLTISMVAPKEPGYYLTYWALMEGSLARCTFYVEIFVDPKLAPPAP